eukprot:1136145-Lingulodinium_polyedra.AAC.1
MAGPQRPGPAVELPAKEHPVLEPLLDLVHGQAHAPELGDDGPHRHGDALWHHVEGQEVVDVLGVQHVVD